MTQDDHSVQSAALSKGITYEGGFARVVIAQVTDTQWLNAPRPNMLNNQDPNAGLHPGTLALPAFHLEGVDYNAARSFPGKWINAF